MQVSVALSNHDLCASAKIFMIGIWKGSVPIPEQSFEDRITQLEGEDKELLLVLMRRVLCWLPEERPTAVDIANDEFLMQCFLAVQPAESE